jgi:hypothetical protein
MTLRKLVLTAVVLGGLVAGEASAFGRRGVFVRQAAQPAVVTSYAPSAAPAGSGGVQWKADMQARSGRCFHPGGGFVAGANYEGVGYSSVSPQDALNHCCNNGGPVVAQAVAKGPGGWYAVKQYAQPGTGPVRTAVTGTFNTVGATLQSAGVVVQNVGTLTLPQRTGACANGVCR